MKLLLFLFLFFLSSSPVLAAGTISVNPNVKYQTMVGWEATTQSGETDSPYFNQYKNQLFDSAVNDLGLNRVRLETRKANCTQNNGKCFDLNELDSSIDKVVLPLKQRLEARGEKLWVNVCIVRSDYASDPDGYAAAALDLMNHMKTKYGFVPDSWEIALEPDNFGWGNYTNVYNALEKTYLIFKANGYPTDHYFVVPSNTDMQNAWDFGNGIFGLMTSKGIVPNSAIKEFSYHRYAGVSDATLTNIGNKSKQLGIGGAMLEHIGSGVGDLIKDLTLGNNSSWQQFTLAYPTSDDGAQYFLVGPTGSLQMASRTIDLAQFFRYVRKDAVRIEAVASGATGTFLPLAFINSPTNALYPGSMVVVVHKSSSNTNFTITGLAPGTYGVNYTKGTAPYNQSAPDQVVGTNGTLVFNNTANTNSVAFYQKTLGTTPVPSPTPTPIQNPIKDGNADGVGGVDTLDLRAVLAGYLKTVTSLLNQYSLDQKLNAFDFVVVLKRLP